MTRKANFWKCIMGVLVLALLFVGTWAATNARLTSAKKSPPGLTSAKNSSATATSIPRIALPPVALATPTPDLISTVFEVEGDIFDNPINGPEDWDTVNCDGGHAEVKTFLHDGLGTTIYTIGGSKDPSDISVPNSKGVIVPGWQHTSGSVPDKDEILNAYAAKYTGTPNGDTIVAFGADRYSNQGDSFFGAWFFQKNVYAAADGTFRERIGDNPAASDPLARHVVGDLLVLINFTGGGGTATGQVLEWVPVGTPCAAGSIPIGQAASKTLCDITGTAPVGSVLGRSNDTTGAQAIPSTCDWNAQYTPKSGTPGTIPAAHFFEGAINLDAFPALKDACFNAFLIETRSSSSPSAQLKDFTLGEFNTCPKISLTKTADDKTVCEGSPTTYTYKVTNPTALNLTITLVDDNETPGDPLDDRDVIAGCSQYNLLGNGVLSTAPIGPGDTSYQCTRTLGLGEHKNVAKVVASIAGSSAEATATETVNVYSPPTADAGNDQSVCLNAGFGTKDFSLSGTVTNGTPSWEILAAGNTANCSIINPPGANTLTPTVRCTAFGSATARLTATSTAPSGTDCPNATNDLVLTIKPNATAVAGDDQSVCVDDTFTSTDFHLSGTVTNATPSWSLTNNTAGCSISNGDTLTPTVTCTALGTATVKLLATSNDGCANSSDELVLNVYANPEAAAGPDQIACSAGATTAFTLAGVADHGTTLWTVQSGPAVINGNASVLNPSVTFTGTGSAVLRLTTTSAHCGSTYDEVTLTVDPNPTVTICSDSTCSPDEDLLLTANVSPGGGTVTYLWTGPGVTGATTPTVVANAPGNYSVSVTRKATPNSPACPDDSPLFHVGLCGGQCQ